MFENGTGTKKVQKSSFIEYSYWRQKSHHNVDTKTVILYLLIYILLILKQLQCYEDIYDTTICVVTFT